MNVHRADRIAPLEPRFTVDLSMVEAARIVGALDGLPLVGMTPLHDLWSRLEGLLSEVRVPAEEDDFSGVAV